MLSRFGALGLFQCCGAGPSPEFLSPRGRRGFAASSFALFDQKLTTPTSHCYLNGMAILTFDTHKVIKAFERAGLSEDQVEDVTAAIGEVVGENVTTQADLHALELRLSKQL